MSKIICDVCGTAYPETATQCPICGCAKPDNAEVSAADISGSEKERKTTYTYVKGGRFSKANVRKRNKANQNTHDTRSHREEIPQEEENRDRNRSSNRGLVAVVIILLLAIVAVVAYIGVRYFLPSLGNQSGQQTLPNEASSSATTAPAVTTAPTTEPDTSCTDLIISDSVVEIDSADAVWLLNVTPVPENTKDVITYESSDPTVATVTAEGRVTSVAPGQAIITITCGDVVKECRIICLFETDPTEPPTEATTAPTVSNVDFKLNREDITLSYQESWQLYDGPISKLEIIWTSDDPNVATIDGGLVTAVGSGTTQVHGEYNGQKVTCIIRTSF